MLDLRSAVKPGEEEEERGGRIRDDKQLVQVEDIVRGERERMQKKESINNINTTREQHHLTLSTCVRQGLVLLEV